MKTYLALLLFLFFLLPFSIHADSIQYTTLAPIQNVGDNPEGTTVTIGDDGSSFGKYLNDVYKFGIALCGALAVLMIVIGGVQYVSSDAWSGKEVGKERITAAMLGLVVALGSYVLLRIVSPKLLNTTLSVARVDVQSIPPYIQNGYVQNPGDASIAALGPGYEGIGPTGDKVNFPAGINVQASGKTIDSSMAYGLLGMQTELANAGINWTVTEGYPPSREHKNPCHQNGTCIDADFLGGDTPENINKFLSAANSHGFDAVWEVESYAERDRLVKAGIPADRVAAYPGWISGSHFSVYNKKKK